MESEQAHGSNPSHILKIKSAWTANLRTSNLNQRPHVGSTRQSRHKHEFKSCALGPRTSNGRDPRPQTFNYHGRGRWQLWRLQNRRFAQLTFPHSQVQSHDGHPDQAQYLCRAKLAFPQASSPWGHKASPQRKWVSHAMPRHRETPAPPRMHRYRTCDAISRQHCGPEFGGTTAGRFESATQLPPERRGLHHTFGRQQSQNNSFGYECRCYP